MCHFQGPEWIPTMNVADKLALKHARPHLKLTDKWELQLDDITINEGEPLGTGFFGVVYKGLLTQHLKPHSQYSLRRSRSSKSTCAVAIKTLKGEKCMLRITPSL